MFFQHVVWQPKHTTWKWEPEHYNDETSKIMGQRMNNRLNGPLLAQSLLRLCFAGCKSAFFARGFLIWFLLGNIIHVWISNRVHHHHHHNCNTKIENVALNMANIRCHYCIISGCYSERKSHFSSFKTCFLFLTWNYTQNAVKTSQKKMTKWRKKMCGSVPLEFMCLFLSINHVFVIKFDDNLKRIHLRITVTKSSPSNVAPENHDRQMAVLKGQTAHKKTIRCVTKTSCLNCQFVRIK